NSGDNTADVSSHGLDIGTNVVIVTDGLLGAQLQKLLRKTGHDTSFLTNLEDNYGIHLGRNTVIATNIANTTGRKQLPSIHLVSAVGADVSVLGHLAVGQVSQITGSSGDDALTGSKALDSNGMGNTFVATAGSDSITGNSGNDTLSFARATGDAVIDLAQGEA